MAIELSRRNLPALSRSAKLPAYETADLTPGILHIGVGNFHRAHQAVFLDDLFNSGRDLDWGLIGAGIRDADEAMRRDLVAQDFLTTVVEQEADRSSARIIGPMIDFLEPGNTRAVLQKLKDPAIRIVSLTVTEGGYYIDPASRNFDSNHPDIIADAADIGSPKTAFGLILSALIHRRAEGIPAFTIMSCDNVPGNGHVTQDAVAGLAALLDPDLACWIRENVAFPNSMVDRITPATSDHERELLKQSYGILDRRPVFCEAFRQWVLEDRFPSGRPALETVGVQFVDNVMPFELMKIRILNGGHAAIAYPAALMDIVHVHEAMAEPLIGRFLSKLLDDEIIPVVPPVPGTDLAEYKALIEGRFANPKIADTIPRLCFDGSNRQPKFILPSVADRLRRTQSVQGLALVCAFWCRYCYGQTDSGALIAPNDPNWQRLQRQARMAKTDPEAWLAMSDIFGDVAQDECYVSAFSHALAEVWGRGTRHALTRYVDAA
jgi:mannitol 2-dehydrogenase